MSESVCVCVYVCIMYLCVTIIDYSLSVPCIDVGPIKSCCLQLSQTRVHPNNVVDYTVQTTVLCPIDAIVSVHYNNISYTVILHCKD